MNVYISYLVVLATIVVFFGLCWLVFRDKPSKEERRELAKEKYIAKRVPAKKKDYGAHYYGNEEKEELDSRIGDELGLKQEIVPPVEDHIRADAAEQAPPYEAEHTSPEKVHPIQEPPHVAPFSPGEDQTRVLSLDDIREALAEKNVNLEDHLDPLSTTKPLSVQAVQSGLSHEAIEPAIDATQVISASAIAAMAGTMASAGVGSTVAESGIGASDATSLAMQHFIHSYGILSSQSRQSVEDITNEALARLGIQDDDEMRHLLENIVVQEALFCMQKAYVATPTEWMRETALTAFLDVVQQPKSSTPYLVAFDALRILPHLTLGHFQSMAIALLLQYSRNSNNYSLEHFQHYVQKYIEPFLSDLPRDESMYRQLDYLRCSVQGQERLSFAQVLNGSYPFVFGYRGFTIDELSRALGNEKLAPQFVVNSLNSSLKKLALVDEGMAPRFFRMAGISDTEVQQNLIQLAMSKPTAFAGHESVEIMDRISPVLANFGQVYNTSGLSQMSLTLLGLYLARAHVKVTIGEEFDLSRWF